MFVFTSVLIAATWFIARFGWDRLRPDWRARPERQRARFVAITATGAVIAIGGFGGTIGSIYGLASGLGAAAALLPIYCFIAFVLRMLLSSFHWEE